MTAENAGAKVIVMTKGVYVTVEPTVNKSPPTMTGKPKIGSILTCNPGEWTGDRTLTYTYQWLMRGYYPISGATDASYAVTEAVGMEPISCKVTATSERGGSASVTTDSVTIAVDKPENVEKPVVSFYPNWPGVLQCTSGKWKGDPSIYYSYRWQIEGTDVPGKTGSWYQPTKEELGTSPNVLVTCVVTANNKGGKVEAAADGVEILSSGSAENADAGALKIYTQGSNVSGEFNVLNSASQSRNFTAALTIMTPDGTTVFSKSDFTGSASANGTTPVKFAFQLPTTAANGKYKAKVSVTWK